MIIGGGRKSSRGSLVVGVRRTGRGRRRRRATQTTESTAAQARGEVRRRRRRRRVVDTGVVAVVSSKSSITTSPFAMTCVMLLLWATKAAAAAASSSASMSMSLASPGRSALTASSLTRRRAGTTRKLTGAFASLSSSPLQSPSYGSSAGKRNGMMTSSIARRNAATAASTTSLSSSSSSSSSETEFDVIVVGGGHAGCDAAAAAARTGARTALVTQRLDTIGELSCNPSVGGIGKGHLVREIDALDGVMGTVADEAGIHFRVLNRRKGPAVRGPRAQMDRDLYKASMQSTLRSYPNLRLIEASVQDLLLDESDSAPLESLAPVSSAGTVGVGGMLGSRDALSDHQRRLVEEAADPERRRRARIRGVLVERTVPTTTTTTDSDEREGKGTETAELFSRSVVVTTGTFLRGVLMLGHDRYSGGRHLRDSEHVEPPSVGLAKTLERYDFPLGRLKTGTPARIDGDTVRWDECDVQPSEVPAQPFSHVRQFEGVQPPMVEAGRLVDCHQTRTNEETHRLVMEYGHTLPTYDGMEGKGNGPRYCPSIFKKVQRFPDRTGHNCFLEPEGIDTNVVYPNGMSGPYPPEIQQKILRTMKGLGAVEIIRPGYDVEYDFVNPQSLTHTMETKSIGGLYLAGQICGTTGYEEAAAQGIVAGANAGRSSVAARDGAKGSPPPLPFVIGRDEGYIGVLIDDLVTRGTSEPYRMFTSRAEYRISLRADNADLRLTRRGVEYGLVVDEGRAASAEARMCMVRDRVDALQNFYLKVPEWAERGGEDLMGGKQMTRKTGQKKSAAEVLTMPHVTLRGVEDIMVAIRDEEKTSQQEGDDVEGGDDHDDDGGDDEEEDMGRSPASVYDTVEASIKYKSYVRRQHKDMESWRRAQGLRIPPDVTYDHRHLPTLKSEELEKLNDARPGTFAEASRISGLRPQSLVYLYHHVQRRNRSRETGEVVEQGRRG